MILCHPNSLAISQVVSTKQRSEFEEILSYPCFLEESLGCHTPPSSTKQGSSNFQ